MTIVDKRKNDEIPLLTGTLILINIVVYFVLELIGNTESTFFMLEHGAMFPPYIVENGEYWRFLTAVFLHFGSKHLMNNMILLAAAGNILEKAIGRWRFLFLYLGAGIGGSLLSFSQMWIGQNYKVSAGASGAVFGLIGGLLWVVICHHGHYQSLTWKGMIFMILLALYIGFSTAGVDNWGHLGGLIMGFVICMIVYRSPIWYTEKDE